MPLETPENFKQALTNFGNNLGNLFSNARTKLTPVNNNPVAPQPTVGLVSQITNAGAGDREEEEKIKQIQQNNSPFIPVNAGTKESPLVNKFASAFSGGCLPVCIQNPVDQEQRAEEFENVEGVLQQFRYVFLDIMNGLVKGLGQSAKTLSKGIEKAGKAFKDLITDGLEEIFKPLLSVDLLQNANSSRNLEKYMQAQFTNLQGQSVLGSQERAGESIVSIEQTAAKYGLSGVEQQEIAKAMTTITPEIAARSGLDQSQLVEFLAKAQTSISDLGGGEGVKISEIVTQLMTGQLNNQQVADSFGDVILSRMQDASKGRSITGNPLADFQNLFDSVNELDQEVDLSSLTKTNPQRIFAKFQADMFNPRTGVFGFLQTFDLTDSISGDSISTNLLTQVTELMTVAGKFFTDFLSELAYLFTGSTGMSPLQAVGTLMDQFTGFIKSIDVVNFAATFKSFFDYLAKVLTLENITEIGGALETVGSILGGLAGFLKENSLALNAAITLILYKLGGLPLVLGKVALDATAGKKGAAGTTLAVGGAMLAAPIITGIASSVFKGFVQRQAYGLAGSKMGGAANGMMSNMLGQQVTLMAGQVIVATNPAAIAASSPITKLGNASATSSASVNTLGSATGNAARSATPLTTSLLGLAKNFGIAALVTGTLVGAFQITRAITGDFGYDMKNAGRDAKDGIKMLTSGFRSFLNQLNFMGAGDRAANSTGITEAQQEADTTSDTTLTSSSSADDVQTMLKDYDTESNYAGNPASADNLINNIYQAIATENNNKPGASDTYLSALNTSETVLNQKQLESIPGAVSDRLSYQNIAQRTSTNQNNNSIASSSFSNSLAQLSKPSTVSTTNSSPTFNISPVINIQASAGQSEKAIADLVIQQISNEFQKQQAKYFA